MAIKSKFIIFDTLTNFLGTNGIRGTAPSTDYIGNVPKGAVVFIKDTGLIWFNGNYFGPNITNYLNNYYTKSHVNLLLFKKADDPFVQYLTFTSLQDDNVISFRTIYSLDAKTISISTDNGLTWISKTSSTSGTELATLNAGLKLLVKGNNTSYCRSNSVENCNRFSSTKEINVSGNIMSLIYGDNFIGNNTLEGTNTFAGLFKYCINLIHAYNLILPSEVLVDNCYSNMFALCSKLISAPLILSKTLGYTSLAYMFSNCSSLKDVYPLYATTFGLYSCYYMFSNCTSLTKVPDLPNATLASACYSGMFSNCTSLTTAPELPSTTLASYCYSNMFYNCTSLRNPPKLPATTLASYCYTQMFFGCTSLKVAPKLPATTLASDCYNQMFRGCSSLTDSPELPATTLANYCYYQMFNGCTNLNYIKCLTTNISARGCTSNWVTNVSETGTFVTADNAPAWTTDTSGIPSGWTVYTESEYKEIRHYELGGTVSGQNYPVLLDSTTNKLYVNVPWTDNNTTSFTITANATDGLWDITGTSGTNAVTYAVGAYGSQQSKASFDTSSTAPTRSDRLNYNGHLYATKLFSGGIEVLTSHQSLSNYYTKTESDNKYVYKSGDTITGNLEIQGSTTLNEYIIINPYNSNYGSNPVSLYWNDVKHTIVGNTKLDGTNNTVVDFLHSGNSSVSKSGETLTVKINGTSLSLTNTNTWNKVSTSQDGYVASIGSGNADSYNKLTSSDQPVVLAFRKGVNGVTDAGWFRLPDNAFLNNTYDLSKYLPLTGGTMTGAITMNTGTGIAMKYTSSQALTDGAQGDPWIYPNGVPAYGIRYFEGNPDIMTFSTSGNNTSKTSADFAINGDGVLYNKGNIIATQTWVGNLGYLTSSSLASYLPLAGGTMGTNAYIGFDNDAAAFRMQIGADTSTSPLRGITTPTVGGRWIGIFARPGKSTDEGGFLLSQEGAAIYNSFDSGFGFKVVDTDANLNDWNSEDSVVFSVKNDNTVYSKGGFVKKNSSDSYVLLGSGGHKAISDFATASTTFVGYKFNDSIGGRNYFSKNTIAGMNTVSMTPSINGYTIYNSNSANRIQNLGFNGYVGNWTVTFEIKASAACSVNVNLCDTLASTEHGEQSTTSVTTEYVKHRYVFLNVDRYNTAENNGYNGFLDIENSDSRTIYVKDIKIEKGIIASDWFYAPEDLATQTWVSSLITNGNVLEVGGFKVNEYGFLYKYTHVTTVQPYHINYSNISDPGNYVHSIGLSISFNTPNAQWGSLFIKSSTGYLIIKQLGLTGGLDIDNHLSGANNIWLSGYGNNNNSSVIILINGQSGHMGLSATVYCSIKDFTLTSGMKVMAASPSYTYYIENTYSKLHAGNYAMFGDLMPRIANTTYNLGSASYKWNNLYLSNSLSDGTNSLTVANIKSTYDWYQTMITENPDGIINRWKEIENFVNGISDTSTLNGILLNYFTYRGTYSSTNIASSTPTQEELTDTSKLNGLYRVLYSGASGALLNFNGAGSTSYVLFYTTYNSGMLWRQSTDANYNAWRTILDSSNYTSFINLSLANYLPLSGGWMTWNSQIYFKGKDNSTSVYSKIGYTTSASGKAMHCISNGNNQNDGAFYITSNGSTSSNDTGGIAIDNEGVTVFGAGDAGSNFTGVFRVLNEDNVDDGPQFLVTKNSGATTKYSHTAQRFISNVETGTLPYACTSTTLNTNLNADLLDGLHGSYYATASSLASYLPLSGGTLTGYLGYNSLYLPIVKGGVYTTNEDVRTGCLTINLPADISNTMTSMWVDVYNYSTGTSFSVHIGGYAYSSSTWQHNPAVMVYGALHRVRLGYNNGFKIYIGETDSTWHYPQVLVRDVICGYNCMFSKIINSWSISFETSLPTIPDNANRVEYAWTTRNFNPSNYALASSLDGYVKNTGDTMTGGLIFARGTDDGFIFNKYNNTNYPILRSHNNGNISLSASGSGLYIGYQNTSAMYFLTNNSTIMSITDKVGIGTTSPSYLLDVNGTTRSTYVLSILMSARYLDAGKNAVHTDHNLYIGYGAQTYTNNTYLYYSTGSSGSDSITSRACHATVCSYGFNVTSHLSVGSNLASYDTSYVRAELDVISTTDTPCDIWLGVNKTRYWYLSARDSSQTNNLWIGRTNGSGIVEISVPVSATEFTATSDVRLKRDIQQISDHIYSFRFKDSDKLQYGFIALELEKEHPDLVGLSEYKTVNYNSALSLYVAELENRVKMLENEINNLKNK